MNTLRERLSRFDASFTSVPVSRRAAPSLTELRELGFTLGPHGVFFRERFVDHLPSPSVLDARFWRITTGHHSPPPRPWLVFDTETTGLESGTGTLVFLAGWVEWADEGARCIQFFMPEPANERGLLDAVVEAFDRAGAIISYNGKSFDLPRLRSRLRLQRRDLNVENLPHLDLLYPCRRLARGWLADSRLSTLERALLGVERVDDLPGSEVPEVYRAFLRGDRSARLRQLVEHNSMDVVHLAELAGAVAGLLNDGGNSLPPRPQLSLARWMALRGEVEAARMRLEGLCHQPGEIGREALWLLAQMDRRSNRLEAARSRLVQLTLRAPHWLEPWVELAKLLEHRFHDYLGARDMVLSAMEGQRRSADLGMRRPAAAMRELRHRLSRIERKRNRL